MKTCINLSQWLKNKLNDMFTENPNTTAKDIIDRFTDKFEYVTGIGYMPADEAEHAYKYYGDRVGFMMSNDGMTPEEYYVQRYMDEETAKSIVQFYKKEDGINCSLKDLAYYLYRHDSLHFGNLLTGYHLVPLSSKHIRGKKARDYIPVHKLYKPRYFQVCYGDNSIRTSSEGAFAAVIQPDSRKNEYIDAFGPAFFVLNPYTIFRPV